ncbi:serine/threonine-protein kinase [Actinomadura fibrosa]|uniref:Protein kinase n=1 Tax=Actinomadura fibrosa TaxID=111802 RepID=A0ABW2XDV0_9ACTN|nr:serine/threonine-protein kinase [Actinomadura fibrosa]
MASPLPLEPADPTRLGGCELLGRIGTGGQGVVFLGRPAEPGDLPPLVAVKLLHAQLLGNAAARARFVRELALLQRVAGFCTAQMLAADMVGDRPYIVSEYVAGRSLRELVLEEGPRAGADLDRLAISSVTALTAIHRAGIVHRDFKPQNVLMGQDGPRVIDFGIARAFDAGATLTSQVVGTPAYMAPEQFAGRVVPATDLFAWAATLLFAATGRDPFAGGPLPAVMYRIMHETPDLSALPGPIAEVAAACLAQDPAARPTSEEALLRLLGDRASTAPSRRSAAPASPPPPRTAPLPGTPDPATWASAQAPSAPAPPPSASPGYAPNHQPPHHPSPHPAQGPNSPHAPTSSPYAPTPGTSTPAAHAPGTGAPPPYAPGRPATSTPAPPPGEPAAFPPSPQADWPTDPAPGPPAGQAAAFAPGPPQVGGWSADPAASPSAVPPDAFAPNPQLGSSAAPAANSPAGPPAAFGPGSPQGGWYADPAAGAVRADGASPWVPAGEPTVDAAAPMSGRAAAGRPVPGGGPYANGAGTAPAPYPDEGVREAGAQRSHAKLRRGPSLLIGLAIAGLLAALDVAALAILIARPNLTVGHRGDLLPLVAGSFTLVAVVTLVAVILAWKGSRAAAWTVVAARVARVAMWAAWGALVPIQVSALAGHALLTALVVLLLARGIWISPRRRPAAGVPSH